MLTKKVHKRLIQLSDAHQKADEYKSGTYSWKNGACAIGCAIRDCKSEGLIPRNVDPGDHAALAKATGIPEMVLRLEDNVFEGLAAGERPSWPPRFWRAVNPSADYTHLPARIMARLADRLAVDAINADVRESATAVSNLWRRRAAGDEPSEAEWKAVEQQAYAASQQADAARQQAYAASQQADAARQQADAAWQQAYAARQQAYAAWQQADAARQQADAAWQQADAASQQADAAWQQAYAARQQADAAWQQADAARQDFWKFVADVICEELAA